MGLLQNVCLSVHKQYPHLASKQVMGTPKTTLKGKVPQPDMFFKSKNYILGPNVTDKQLALT
jgi:hypothetical protein